MTEIPTTIKNQELVEKRREQIVLAAIKLFSERGFYKTTLRDLAEEVGISTGNFYHYVSSKEDIFFLIHQFLADLAEESLVKSTENVTDPIEKLHRMIRAEFDLMDKWADGVLLIYQEGHILSKKFLSKLLKRERSHLEKIETAIEECDRKGLLRNCNVRLAANLIKCMVDAWVLKRWDIRAYVDRLEAERMVLDIIFHGLLQSKEKELSQSLSAKPLRGKSALVVNGGTVLGAAICSCLLANGARAAVYLERDALLSPSAGRKADSPEGLRYYSSDRDGGLGPDLFNRISQELGPIDFIVQDVGIGNTELTEAQPNGQADQRLETNLRRAEEIVHMLMTQISEQETGQVIYLTPWAWDRLAAPIRYETVKAAILALARTSARTLASSGLRINCVVPGFLKMSRPSKVEKKSAAEILKGIPIGRLGEISDVTNAVLFLATDKSKYITGQALSVAGGLT
ncbi:MAG: SDR family oxidoreductase [Thermodesulfobacteriota bacterium]